MLSLLLYMSEFAKQGSVDIIRYFLCLDLSSLDLFWKLLKGQRSTSQMSAFLVENKLITDKNLIREMWADHFEALGTPQDNENFDSNFLTYVTASVADILKSCAEDPSGPFVLP